MLRTHNLTRSVYSQFALVFLLDLSYRQLLASNKLRTFCTIAEEYDNWNSCRAFHENSKSITSSTTSNENRGKWSE